MMSCLGPRQHVHCGIFHLLKNLQSNMHSLETQSPNSHKIQTQNLEIPGAPLTNVWHYWKSCHDRGQSYFLLHGNGFSVLATVC